jgi:hypothetical protein
MTRPGLSLGRLLLSSPDFPAVLATKIKLGKPFIG